MYFPSVARELFHLMLGFYILPLVIILAVWVFPRPSYLEHMRAVGVLVLCLMQSYLFYFLWIIHVKLKWNWQPAFKPKVVKIRDTYRHFMEFFAEYDWIYIILDSLNVPLIFLNIIVTSLSIYYAILSSTSYRAMQKSVLNLTLVMILLNIIFSTLNLAVFYIAFEVLILPLFFLIGMGSRLRRLRAAMLFFMYTITFSYVMLFGLIYAWTWFGTLHYPKILIILYSLAGSNAPLYLIWGTLLIAFLAKIPLIPAHIWLPEAHVEASTVGSVVLASLVLKIGAYGIIRFLVPLHGLINQEWLFVFLVLFSLAGALYATLMSFAQVDLKRVVAYSSIAHLSFAVAGIFTTTKYGIIGGYYYNLGHGFISAALFFLVGMLYKRHGTRLLKYYSGLALLPYFSAFLLFFSFANIGFPGTINFISEFFILSSFVFVGSTGLLVLASVVFFGSMIFSIWTYLRLAGGSITQHILYAHYDLEPYERIILTVLVLCTVLLGVFPKFFFFNFFKIC